MSRVGKVAVVVVEKVIITIIGNFVSLNPKNKHIFAVMKRSQFLLTKTYTVYARQVTDAHQQFHKKFKFYNISLGLIIV